MAQYNKSASVIQKGDSVLFIIIGPPDEYIARQITDFKSISDAGWTPVDMAEKPKIIGDTHYGSGNNRRQMANLDIELIAPPSETVK
ncbi:MAG: hypothetical protein ACYCX4_08135, partial [Bacillota bacterium]